ncbi:MAG: ABC transporter ATP-binding protein [Alkalinema sp. CACIAM 70d]|nr:MAG: ABC transporter ATP-binding protein [Alkalinema sp. CACIAM 70d]
MKCQVIRQHSKEDCGAACLAAIAKYYKRTLSLNQVREAVGTGQLGTTLLGLRRGAEVLGFSARSGKASADILDHPNALPLPAVIHWKGYHWVVLYGKRRNKYVIADPAIGLRYLSRKELEAGWTNRVMLLVKPDPDRFLTQPDETVNGFWRFAKRAWQYRNLVLQASLFAQMIGVLSLASPLLVQILTDDVLVRGDSQLLTTVIAAVVAMLVLTSLFKLVQYTLIAHFAQRLQLGLALEFGRHLLRLPLSYYETRRSGEIVSRLEDIERINGLISDIVIRLPSQFFIALVSFAFMLFYSSSLTVIAVILAIVMTLSTVIFLPTLQQKVRRVLVLEAENHGVLVETFKGALTVKTTTAEADLWEEFQQRFSHLANEDFRTTQISIINRIFSGFVSGTGSMTLLGVGSLLVINKELSIGQLLAFSSMNSYFLGFISDLVSFINDFIRAKTAVQRLTEVIDSTPETDLKLSKPTVRIPDNAEVICDQVNFFYPGRVELLENFSITIPGGQVTALIGRSGCGKSTLSKLIAGLYKLQSGNIRIGHYNLDDFSLESVRQQVVLIPQDAHFWSRSIIDNFRLGGAHLSFEQIVKACQIADADDFISKLPDKYQTVLGEFGANLSGGQRQRLAIARAIASDPPILILDESTSGLDPIGEAKVLAQLLEHRRGKTTILISHRPSVIQLADWIVMLEEGRLKMAGKPEELQLQTGEYLQFLGSPSLLEEQMVNSEFVIATNGHTH